VRPEREIEKLIAAARGNRWGQRDATMILIAFRHGLRASKRNQTLSRSGQQIV
jgi:hypothetical protein